MTRLATLVVALAGARMAQAGCTFSWKAAAGDTCASMSSDWGVSVDDFIKWNPSVGAGCKNGLTVGNDYCVEYSGEPGGDPTTTTPSTPTTTPPDSGKPSPTQPGLIDTCTTFYKTKTGDYCQAIVDQYGTFTIDDFVKWNPAVKSDCSGLFADYYYCVGVPGTPTSRPTTTTTAPGNGKPSPTQPGLIDTCTTFYKTKTGDYCQAIVDQYGTFTIDDFVKWNPAVKSDCSGLFADYYYCVGVPGTPTTRPTTTSAPPSGPSPTQSGITKDCTKFYQAQTGDYCDAIVNKYGTFSMSQFVSWNPAIKSDCSGLFAGYYYCVGVPGTPDKPTTTQPSGPSPTQSGVAKNCQEFYKVQSGDYCDQIIDKYNKRFSLQQFVSWNPAVGSDCKGLWVGYYVCVRA